MFSQEASEKINKSIFMNILFKLHNLMRVERQIFSNFFVVAAFPCRFSIQINQSSLKAIWGAVLE